MAFDIKYTIQLIDEFSANAKKIKGSLKRIDSQIQKASRVAEKASRKFKQFGKTISTHVSLPLGIGAAAAIHTTATFERSMSTIKALTDATKKQMHGLGEETLKLASKNIVSANQIAQSAATMSQFHLSLEQVKELLGPSMRFAVANQVAGIVDMNSAAKIGVRVTKAYGLSLSQVPKVLDSITAVTQRAHIPLERYLNTLKFTDTVLSGLKVPFDDMNAAVALLAKKQITAGMAGRGMARLIKQMIHPTGELKKAFKKLNIDMADSQGRFKGLGPMIKMLTDNFTQMGAQALFTGQSGRIASAFIAEGLPIFEAYQKTSRKGGLLQKLYRTQTDNLAGSISQLNNSIQSLSISLVETQKGPLTTIIRTLQKTALHFLGLSETTKKTISTTLAFGIALGPIIYSVGKFALVFVLLSQKIAFIGNLIASLSLGFETVIGIIAGPFAIVIIGMGLAALAVYKLYSNFKLVHDFVNNLIKEFEFLIDHPLESLINTLKQVGHMFTWVYNLTHKKPLIISRKLSTEHIGNAMNNIHELRSYADIGPHNRPPPHAVKSTLDVNVFDPHRYIKNIAGRTSEGDLNLNLGYNMAFSR